jgi:hypothetical protein
LFHCVTDEYCTLVNGAKHLHDVQLELLDIIGCCEIECVATINSFVCKLSETLEDHILGAINEWLPTSHAEIIIGCHFKPLL